VMGCNKRPVLVGEPHGPWSGRCYSDSFFSNLTYDISGELFPIDKKIMPKDWEKNKQIKSAKNRLQKAGYASQNDANYFGMKVLEQYPKIAKAIIYRFPSFIIDEAQDTSEIQMRIIDLLIDNGLDNIMLVGDPDQAIFEWNGANPQLFLKKYDDWRDNSIILNENRRSSQNICNCSCRLSTLKETSTAINEDVKEYPFIPLVKTYNNENMNELLTNFLDICSDYNVDVTPEKVAVIYRSKNIFNAIIDSNEIKYNNLPWIEGDPYSKYFAKGKFLCNNGQFSNGFKLIQNTIIKARSGSLYCSEQDLTNIFKLNGFAEFRRFVYGLINSLPDTSCTIGEWVDGANSVFSDIEPKIELKIKNKSREISLDSLFRFNNEKFSDNNYRIGTIHSAKGETFDAVLVILKQKGAIGKYYKTMLKENLTTYDNEELRIVYVGITRPRKLLLLAVPDEENRTAWENRLFNCNDKNLH
ncbi:MAG: ATP-dependent helicase, partial [Elusimicrobiota bacterium]